MQAIKLFKTIFSAAAVGIVAVALCACGEKSPEEIAQTNKRKAELAVRRAQVMSAENKNAQAVEMLETAYRELGALPNVCEALGNALAQEGKTDSAGVFYEQAFDGDNSRLDLLVFAANAYEQTSNWDAAEQAYLKYLAKKNDDPSAHKHLAKIYQKQGNFEKSLNEYMAMLKTAKRNPDTAEAAVIGGLFFKIGNTAQAKLWLESALKVTLPENTATRREIYTNLIGVYLQKKDMAGLESAIKGLDAIDPEIVNEKFPTLKAQLAEFKHRLAEAEAAMDKDRRVAETERASQAEEKQKDEEREALARAEKEGEEAEKALEQKRTSQEGGIDAAVVEKQSAPEQQPETKPTPAVAAPAPTPANDKPDGDKPAENKPADSSPEKSESAALNEIAPASATNAEQSAPAQPAVEVAASPAPAEETDFARDVRLALEALAKEDKPNALLYAEKAIADNPQNSASWSVAARAYEINGRRNDAYLAAKEAFLCNAADPEVARTFLRLSQIDQPKENFLKDSLSVYAKLSDDPEVVYYLANAYLKNADAERAAKFFKKYAELGGERNGQFGQPEKSPEKK